MSIKSEHLVKLCDCNGTQTHNSYKIISFFFTGVFGKHSNISGGAFLQKILIAKSCSIFLQKNSTIDFWSGSKYSS